MKALVTGGGGFLGRVIVEKLLERGDSVRVLGRNKYPDLEELGAETVIADIRNPQAVMPVYKGLDAVFHVASKIGIWGKRDDFYRTNVIGTENVIQACRENGIPKLIYTCSPSVIFAGDDLENADETTPYPTRYNSYYSASKAEAEKKVLAENGIDGLYTVSLRPHLIWGPGDTNLIPRVLEKARSGRLVQVGDGKNIVDIVYVDNAAQAHLLAADRLEEGSPVCGQSYFITQKEPVALWDWINHVLSSLGIPTVERSISYKNAYRMGIFFESLYFLLRKQNEPPMTRFLASQLAKSHFFNIKKAKEELGYSPHISHEEGLKRLFEYCRQNDSAFTGGSPVPSPPGEKEH